MMAYQWYYGIPIIFLLLLLLRCCTTSRQSRRAQHRTATSTITPARAEQGALFYTGTDVNNHQHYSHHQLRYDVSPRGDIALLTRCATGITRPAYTIIGSRPTYPLTQAAPHMGSRSTYPLTQAAPPPSYEDVVSGTYAAGDNSQGQGHSYQGQGQVLPEAPGWCYGSVTPPGTSTIATSTSCEPDDCELPDYDTCVSEQQDR